MKTLNKFTVGFKLATFLTLIHLTSSALAFDCRVRVTSESPHLVANINYNILHTLQERNDTKPYDFLYTKQVEVEQVKHIWERYLVPPEMADYKVTTKTVYEATEFNIEPPYVRSSGDIMKALNGSIQISFYIPLQVQVNRGRTLLAPPFEGAVFVGTQKQLFTVIINDLNTIIPRPDGTLYHQSQYKKADVTFFDQECIEQIKNIRADPFTRFFDRH